MTSTQVLFLFEQIPSLEGSLIGEGHSFTFNTVTALAITGGRNEFTDWGIVKPVKLQFNQPLVFTLPPKIEDLVLCDYHRPPTVDAHKLFTAMEADR